MINTREWGYTGKITGLSWNESTRVLVLFLFQLESGTPARGNKCLLWIQRVPRTRMIYRRVNCSGGGCVCSLGHGTLQNDDEAHDTDSSSIRYMFSMIWLVARCDDLVGSAFLVCVSAPTEWLQQLYYYYYDGRLTHWYWVLPHRCLRTVE